MTYLIPEGLETVVAAAEEETRLRGGKMIGTDALLLGIVAVETSTAARLLTGMGGTYAAIRKEAIAITGQGSTRTQIELRMTPRAAGHVRRAAELAQANGGKTVSPEHLLLSMLEELEGSSIRILESLGIDPDKLQAELVQALAAT